MNQEDSVGFQISKTTNKFRKITTELLTKYNIAPEQRTILEIIKNNYNIDQTTLAVIVQKDKTTISRTINTLIKKNFVIKKSSKKDRRLNLLYLTKEALIVLKKSDYIIKSLREKTDSIITLDEKKELFQILNKLNQEL